MASIQEQLQKKRIPIDTWDLKEKLFLASAVVKIGDQNWMTVSRTMKSLGYSTRPADWYSQKNCAAQYGLLLENVETPKRKKRTSGVEPLVETLSESILKRLKDERILELKRIMTEEKRLYIKIKEEIECVRSGKTDEQQLKDMCLQIDQEKKQKEREAVLHEKWLKDREEKKMELERSFRSVNKLVTGQKRKLSDNVEGDGIKTEPNTDESQDTNKPATSPLLTSLLKSPSITGIPRGNKSPTIASLLNSTPEVSVSHSLQQLVSTAIGQEPTHTHAVSTPSITVPANTPASKLVLPSIVSTVIGTDIKFETVDSNVIAGDNIDYEEIQFIEEVIFKHVEESDGKSMLQRKEEMNPDNEKIGEIKEELDKPLDKLKSTDKNSDEKVVLEELKSPTTEIIEDKNLVAEEVPEKTEKDNVVEETIVEIITQSEPNDENEKEIEETQSNKDPKDNKESTEDNEKGDVEKIKEEVVDTDEASKDTHVSEDTSVIKEVEIKDETFEVINENTTEMSEKTEESDSKPSDEKQNIDQIEDSCESRTEENENKDKTSESQEEPHRTTLNEFTEADFDHLAKGVIKSERAKRDYSRHRKREDKDIEMFFHSENETEDKEYGDDMEIEKTITESEKKTESKFKVKIENDRSHSPWTEEESEISLVRTRRRYSTPATPNDSVPNSPASSIAGFDDDKEYRAWKKSILLVYNTLATHKYASLFLKPITDDQAPGYHNIVYEAKDLQTLRRNVENGVIKNTNEFIRYVLIMFQNALMYNKTNDYVYNRAKEMQSECIEGIKKWVLAQAQVEVPVKRELRASEIAQKTKREETPMKNIRKRKIE